MAEPLAPRSTDLRSAPTVLTIAGFDPSSGAGITADLLVFAAHGIFATSAITALTVQSTMGVKAVEPVAAATLEAMLATLEEDLPPAGIKIGMLATAAQVEVVAAYLRSTRARRDVVVVLDPVIHSSSGAELLDAEGVEILQRTLLHGVDAVTPNLREAELLTNLPCRTREEMVLCARALQERYEGLTVVLTGGHLESPSDLLLEGYRTQWFHGERLKTRATHGTGCAFSSALLAERVLHRSWGEAASSAKAYVAHAMRRATPLGKGRGPMALFSSTSV